MTLPKYPVAVLILACILCSFAACLPAMRSTLTSTGYDNKKNITNYTVIPYGSVAFPGQWKKQSYDPSSRQQFFVNSDSVYLCVALGPADKFEFSKPGLKGFQFAKAYYDWEIKYQSQQLHKKTELIASDSQQHYVLWRVYDDALSVYFLFAGPDCSCKEGAFEEITIRSNKMDAAAMIQYLKDIHGHKYK